MPLIVIEEARKLMGTIKGKIYVKLWIGMGDWCFYKRDDVGKQVISLSCYHTKVDDLKWFINGYTNVYTNV